MSSMSSIPANRLRPSSKEIPQAAAERSAAAFFLRLRYAQAAKKRNIPFEAGASPLKLPRCSEVFCGSGVSIGSYRRLPTGFHFCAVRRKKQTIPFEMGALIPSSRRCRPVRAPCSAGWRRFSGCRAGRCGRAPPRADRARSAQALACARRVYLLSCVPPCQASPKTARINP